MRLLPRERIAAPAWRMLGRLEEALIELDEQPNIGWELVDEAVVSLRSYL